MAKQPAASDSSILNAVEIIETSGNSRRGRHPIHSSRFALASLPFNPGSLAIDAVVPNPAVDVASVVSNLKPASVHRFDEMQIIASSNPDQHNIIRLKSC
jgi:hypothetical protein